MIRITSLRQAVIAVALAGSLGLSIAACSSTPAENSGSARPSADPSASPSAFLPMPSPSAEGLTTPSPGQPQETAPAGAGDIQAFCVSSGHLSTVFMGLQSMSAGTDIAKLEQEAQEALTTSEDATPPAELTTEWENLTKSLPKMTAALSALSKNPTDQEALSIFSSMQQDSNYITSVTTVLGYARQNCQ